jgi:hypothetical protein
MASVWNSVTSYANVGASAGNELMLYNETVSESGDNKISMDLAMDLSGARAVEIQFEVVDYGSYPSFETASIWLSDNEGSNFTHSTVLALNQAPHNDGVWNEVTYDVTSIIGATGLTQTSTVIFRMAAMLLQKGDYLINLFTPIILKGLNLLLFWLNYFHLSCIKKTGLTPSYFEKNAKNIEV